MSDGVRSLLAAAQGEAESLRHQLKRQGREVRHARRWLGMPPRSGLRHRRS